MPCLLVPEPHRNGGLCGSRLSFLLHSTTPRRFMGLLVGLAGWYEGFISFWIKSSFGSKPKIVICGTYQVTREFHRSRERWHRPRRACPRAIRPRRMKRCAPFGPIRRRWRRVLGANVTLFIYNCVSLHFFASSDCHTVFFCFCTFVIKLYQQRVILVSFFHVSRPLNIIID